MRVLVTGKEGQVARALSALSSEETMIDCCGRPGLDITNKESVERAIAEFRPNVIVNPAAYTAVDKAETESEMAFAVNRDGARNVAAAAAEAKLPVIHISTDYVFAGDKASPYTETDETGPTGIYGASKLAGELAVAESNADHAILRTAWVYSPWGHNFAKTMLRLADNHDTVRVVSDQHGTPTYAPDIAEGILIVSKALAAAPNEASLRGLFHMTAKGSATWAEFAEAIFSASEIAGGPTASVERITTTDYPTTAKRPANSRLNCSKFQHTFGYALPDWHGAVKNLVSVLSQAEPRISKG